MTARVRRRRMQVERHVERLGALEDRPEALVVEKHAACQPVHHGALEAELGHRAFEFVGRRLGVGGRQHRKAGEAVGMGAHGLGEAVVGAARKAHRERGILDPLHRRRAVRQHLHVDPGRVHLGDAALPDIVEARDDVRPAGRVHAGDVRLHLGIEIVLFKSDDLRLRRHLFLPIWAGGESALSPVAPQR